MWKLIIFVLLIKSTLVFAGTANCDGDENCAKFSCDTSEKAYCDIIPGTTGPHDKPMGFCRCKK